MKIHEFISRFSNHPVLFIGTGMSLRYLENSYTWEGLLAKIANDLKGNMEYFFDLKSSCYNDGKYDYSKIAHHMEQDFNKQLIEDRNGKFKAINDIFYDNMQKGINFSRFRIYIAHLLSELKYRERDKELIALKRVRKNIGSVITTNYDKMIEDIFEFNPLIGNNILLSNPYGALYKIHGCIDHPDKIIITEKDYNDFEKRYELIRAQLLSLFIHNPIIFLGYNVGDRNIKDILKTIFTYVEPNSEQSEKIRSNFLLVEYDEGSSNCEVVEHDIDIQDFSTIRINKVKTDNFIAIYDALAALQLPVSAMDIRKVQNVVKEIFAGGSIKVSITDDLEDLDNKDKILVIGAKNTITYTYQTVAETIAKYFSIIDEDNIQILSLIDKYKIQSTQFFPIHGFIRINPKIECAEKLKTQQENKLKGMYTIGQNDNKTIVDIQEDESISATNKINAIVYGILHHNLSLQEVEKHLREYHDKKCTLYRRMLCAFDYVKYAK